MNGINFNQPLQSALMNGDEIIFRGEIADNAQLIQFALLHDAPEWNKYSKKQKKKFTEYLGEFAKESLYLALLQFSCSLLYLPFIKKIKSP